MSLTLYSRFHGIAPLAVAYSAVKPHNGRECDQSYRTESLYHYIIFLQENLVIILTRGAF